MNNGKIKRYLKNKIFEVEIDLKNVKNDNDFIKKMDNIFDFPPYFRKNSYDSMNDCMRDLSWIEEDEIIIIFNEKRQICKTHGLKLVDENGEEYNKEK